MANGVTRQTNLCREGPAGRMTRAPSVLPVLWAGEMILSAPLEGLQQYF